MPKKARDEDGDLLNFVAELVKAYHSLPPYDDLKQELQKGLTRKPAHRAQRAARKTRSKGGASKS